MVKNQLSPKKENLAFAFNKAIKDSRGKVKRCDSVMDVIKYNKMPCTVFILLNYLVEEEDLTYKMSKKEYDKFLKVLGPP